MSIHNQQEAAAQAALIIAECLHESNGDIEAGLAAAEYILSSNTDIIPGGKADDRPDEDFDPKELARGIMVELEHTDSFAIAKEIAKDHLTEDEEYYKKLTKAGLSVNIFLAHDIHNRRAQGILNKALQSVKGMTAAAKDDLAVALEKEDGGQAILEFVNKYRIQLANLLTQTQLAAVLEGANEVAAKIPALEDDLFALGAAQQPSFEHEDSVHLATIEEAAKILAERNVLTRTGYQALDAAARAKSLAVAGVDAQDTLEKIRDTLADNVRKGADYATFKQEILDAVDEGTFLSDAHQETVFRTNVQSAFSDGQMSVLSNPLVRSGFPYASYDPIQDDRVRSEHSHLDKAGIEGSNIYRIDDPVFKLFRPPWDYNCRCSWSPMTVSQAAEAGIGEAMQWMETGQEPAEPAFVDPPPFAPPPGFDRALGDAMLSIRLSMHPMDSFGPDIANPSIPPPTVWTKEDYPRDAGNRFLVKYDIARAARDSNELTKIRESIPEDQRHKLDHAVSIIQSGGTIHHPDEPPEMGVDLSGNIRDFRWAIYAQDVDCYEAWTERETDRKTCKNILHLATRNLRSKTTQDLDHIDNLLADAGIDERATREIARARYKIDNERITKAELEDIYESIIEQLYQKIEDECRFDSEPLKPEPPTSAISARFSTEEWVSDPGPRSRNRWRNIKTGRLEYGQRPGQRGGKVLPQPNVPSKPKTTLPLPKTAPPQVQPQAPGGPAIPRTIPHPPPMPKSEAASIPSEASGPLISAPPVPLDIPKIKTPLPSVRKHEETSESPQSDTIKRLESAPISSEELIGGKSNANGAYKVTIDGIVGVWKPSDEEETLRISIDAGTYYKREAAAYSIASAIGLDHLVPVTVEKEHNGKVGSVMHWVEDADTAFEFGGNEFDGEDDLKLASAFDYLIGNTDRHSGNWMLDNAEGRLHLIDHGLAFPSDTKSDRLRSFLFNECVRQSYDVPDVVSSWDEDRISEELKAHNIEDEAISGVLERLSHLKNIASSGGNFQQLQALQRNPQPAIQKTVPHPPPVPQMEKV